jgi:hypothetical protein
VLKFFELSLSDAIQTHILWAQWAAVGVQLLGLIGLGLYVFFTYGLLKASQRQVEVSQKLIKAGMDQEGLSKPCLTLWGDLRNPSDALMEIGGAVGSTIARGDDGNFVVHNIGNGVALNASYQFEPIDPPHGRRLKGNSGYLQNVLASQKVRMPLPVSMVASGHWQATFQFESLGGRRYRTVISLKGQVLTGFHFVEINETSVKPVVSEDIVAAYLVQPSVEDEESEE